MIRALAIDFDGTILDTERPLYDAWRKIFIDHGHDLPIDLWVSNMGKRSDSNNYFDRLAQLIGEPVDAVAIEAEKSADAARTINSSGPMPGVVELIDEAKARGLKLAAVSSSSFNWVGGHLERLGLLDRFDTTVTRLDTTEHKPHPEPYLLAAERLEVEPGQVIAFEDTVPGIRSAKAAGMTAIAVPSDMTRSLEFPDADARYESLTDISLNQLL